MTRSTHLLRSRSFFFSSRRRHTRSLCDWSSDVCSSDLAHRDGAAEPVGSAVRARAVGGDLLPRRARAPLFENLHSIERDGRRLELDVHRSEERRVGKECRARTWKGTSIETEATDDTWTT